LKVLTQSFSFRRTGYPKDETGHGGGFVFDCRAIDAFDPLLRDNPNAPFPHMHLTGLDLEVSHILDEDLGTQKFYQAVWTMVEMNILKCLSRGFGVMTVNFGCTGGQHRSVYMAERLARTIRNEFPEVDIELIHREKNYWPKSNM